jgi:hypothetical protein
MKSRREFKSSALTIGDRVLAACKVGTLLLLIVVLGLRHPSEYRFVPPCPSAQLGLQCAGCGSLRAIHHLTNARAGEAWRHNPAMIVLGMPAILVFMIQQVRVVAGRRGRVWAIPSAFGWAVLALVVVYSIARNLPGAAFDCLRAPTALRSR